MVTPGIEQLAQARYRMLLQEMGTEQRARKARADFPGLRDRVIMGHGEFLVSLGLRLKERYGRKSAAPAFQVGWQR